MLVQNDWALKGTSKPFRFKILNKALLESKAYWKKNNSSSTPRTANVFNIAKGAELLRKDKKALLYETLALKIITQIKI